jgi:PIN domain nuclease of toxin-antitoxin system
VNLLLDTQALLWWLQGNKRLGRRARRAIDIQAATVHVSAATAWELAIKVRAGRLRLTTPLRTWMPGTLVDQGFLILNITPEHAVAVASLPEHHDDPFDRLLIAQALHEQLTIVTSDTAFDDYDVTVLDART